MIHAKFQPNIPSGSWEKIVFIVYFIFSNSSYLGFSTRLNLTILMPCNLIMLHVKWRATDEAEIIEFSKNDENTYVDMQYISCQQNMSNLLPTNFQYCFLYIF